MDTQCSARVWGHTTSSVSLHTHSIALLLPSPPFPEGRVCNGIPTAPPRPRSLASGRRAPRSRSSASGPRGDPPGLAAASPSWYRRAVKPKREWRVGERIRDEPEAQRRILVHRPCSRPTWSARPHGAACNNDVPRPPKQASVDPINSPPTQGWCEAKHVLWDAQPGAGPTFTYATPINIGLSHVYLTDGDAKCKLWPPACLTTNQTLTRLTSRGLRAEPQRLMRRTINPGHKGQLRPRCTSG